MTILEDNKYIAENAYRQYLQNTIAANATGEIEIQLSAAPISNFGWLILEPDSTANREEIFYHRKSGSSVFTYDVNRTNAKYHADGILVVLNNSAGIYNFKEKPNDNIFFHYKTSDTNLLIFGGVIVDGEGVRHDIDNFNTSDLSLTNNATNYIYIDTLDEGITYGPLSTTTSSNNLFIIKEITKDGVGNITDIKEGRQSWRGISINGGIGPSGQDGVDGRGITSITLHSTDGAIKTYRVTFTDSTFFDYEIVDGVVIPLPEYTIINSTIDRNIDANSVTIHELADVVTTLINDIKDGLEAISIPGEDGIDGADGDDGRGITSIALLSTVDKIKTYRVTFTDATTFDYTVEDGTDGAGGDMFKHENLSGLTNYSAARTNLDIYSKSEVDTLIPDVSSKQDTLVSGTNIKTVNGASILGTGDIDTSQGDKKYCMAGLDASIPVTTGVTKTLDNFIFNSNDSGMFATPTRITITKSGMYLIGGQINFSSNSTGQRELSIRKNGSTTIHTSQIAPATQTGSYTTVSFSRIESLSSGNYLELRAYQTSGTTLDAISSSPYQYTFFYVKEI